MTGDFSFGKMNLKRVLLLLVVYVAQVISLEPISLSVMGGAAAVGSLFAGGYKYIKCSAIECCDSYWITKNITRIEEEVRRKLYGQHIAEDSILSQISDHITRKQPAKPLVLSFHGWTGVGKSYATKLIADGMYREGSKSKFYHLVPSSLYFNDPAKVESYQKQLRDWVNSNSSECDDVHMWVFDEVDKIPLGVLDSLIPFFEANFNSHKDESYIPILDFQKTAVNYRRNIFILLSNTGGEIIAKNYIASYDAGLSREDLTLRHFESDIEHNAYEHERNGLSGSEIISRGFIGLYVPFLPHTRMEIEKCLQDLLPEGEKVTSRLALQIIDNLEFYPEGSHIQFSRTGCKRIPELYRYIEYANRRSSKRKNDKHKPL